MADTSSSPHKTGVDVSLAQFEALLARRSEGNSNDEHGGGLPPGPARVTEAAKIPTGFNNTTYKVTCEFGGDGDATATKPRRVVVAIRVSKLSSWPFYKLEGEVATMRFVRHHAAKQQQQHTEEDENGSPTAAALDRVPRVHFFCNEIPGVTDGLATLCMEWKEGRNVNGAVFRDEMSAAAKQRFVKEAAEFLVALQRLPLPPPSLPSSSGGAVGRIAPGGGCDDGGAASISIAPLFDFGCNAAWPFKGPFPTVGAYWKEFTAMRRVQIDELSARLLGADAENEPLAASIAKWKAVAAGIDAVVDRHAAGALATVQLAVTHYDFCGRNMLVDIATGALNGVVDWEWGMVHAAHHDWHEGFDDCGDECRAAVRRYAHDVLHRLPGGEAFRFERRDDNDGGEGDGATPKGLVIDEAVLDRCPQAVGEAVAYWLFRVTDALFPWTLAAHMYDPAAFPFPAEGPVATIDRLVAAAEKDYAVLPYALLGE